MNQTTNASQEKVEKIQERKREMAIQELKEKMRGLFPYGHPKFIDLLLEEAQLHSDKNYDYAFGSNPLGNFYRVANIFKQYPGLSLSDPRVVALVYKMKQIDAVLWMLCQKHSAKVEGIADRNQDISVYTKIETLIDEEMKNEK